MEQFRQNNYKTEKEENTKEKLPIKEGVDFVFKQNPELATIGNKEQYSRYLDSIFPESAMKDIFYHGSEESFEKFEKKSEENLSPLGYFFTDNLNIAATYFNPIKNNIKIRYQDLNQENKEYTVNFSLGELNNLTEALDAYDHFDTWIENNYQTVIGRYATKDSFKILEITKPEKKGLYSVVLNINTPLHIEFKTGKQDAAEKKDNYTTVDPKNYKREDVLDIISDYPQTDAAILENVSDIRTFRKEGDDDLFIHQKQVAVFNSDQIHILGNKEDLEKFKDFVEGGKTDSDSRT